MLDATLLDRAHALLDEAWGISGTLSPQASERDHLFRVRTGTGESYLLKLTDPDEPAVATDFQTRGILHAAERDAGVPIPRLVPDRQGRAAFRPDWPGERVPTARLLTWIEGEMVVDVPQSAKQADGLGRALAQLGLALADFDHPGADYHLHWDLRHTARLRSRLSAVPDVARRALAEAAIDRFERETSPLLETMRRQVIHADLTTYNALVDKDDPDRVTGIIDFGDMVRTALVCDPAVGAAHLMEDGPDAMGFSHALVAGFHAVRPMSEAEVRLIAPLMEARHAMTVAITEEHAARRPDNFAYITKNTATAWRGLATLASRPMAAWCAGFLRACGMEPTT